MKQRFIRVVQTYYIYPTINTSIGMDAVVYVEAESIEEAEDILIGLGWDLDETTRVDAFNDWEQDVWGYWEEVSALDIIRAHDRSCTLVLAGGEIVKI